jgi:hypothetical protein
LFLFKNAVVNRVNKEIQLTIDLGGGDANRNGLFIADSLSFKPRKPTIQSLSLIFGEDYNFGKIEDGWCIAFLIILIIHICSSPILYRYACDKVQGLIDPGFIGNLNLNYFIGVMARTFNTFVERCQIIFVDSSHINESFLVRMDMF